MTSSPQHMVDLHCHSTASDGSLPPGELVEQAAASGVRVLALTDHDTLAGLPEAAARADALGVQLIPGVEFSCSLDGRTVHIVGLGFAPGAPALQAHLQRTAERREQRMGDILIRLGKVGLGDLGLSPRDDSGAVLTRRHVAEALVEQGHAADIPKAFKRYLARGRAGHVPDAWPDAGDAIQALREAGGSAVLAHPGAYGLTATRLRRLLEAFVAEGGAGLEVSYGQATPNQVRDYAGLARRFELAASAGSDFHHPDGWIHLGRYLPLPEDLSPIWRDWLSSDGLTSSTLNSPS